MSARFLLIALDGADGGLLDQWSSDGTLPNLLSLRERGAVTHLTAPDGVTDDGLWASFKYGAGIGEHGRYFYSQRLDSGKMGMTFLDETDRSAFWEEISNEGNRVAVFDVPKCGFPRPMNGIHLADWLVHGKYFKEPKSFPESLASDVLEHFGPAPPSACSTKALEYSDTVEQETVSNLRLSVASKKAAGVHYLSSEEWDLFIISFKEAHCAGHQFWDLSKPDASHDLQSENTRPGKSLRVIYEDLDAAIGELVSVAGQKSKIAVFSPTDMEPNSTIVHLMPELVNRLNRRFGENRFNRLVRRVFRRIGWISAARPCELLPYNENCTALRLYPNLNILGRFSTVRENKIQMAERIETLLFQLTDPETGQAVIEEVDRPSTEYAGARAELLPDLLIPYSAGTCPTSIVSEELGLIEAAPPNIRPGNHATGGLLITSWKGLVDVSGMQDFAKLAANVLKGGKPESMSCRS